MACRQKHFEQPYFQMISEPEAAAISGLDSQDKSVARMCLSILEEVLRTFLLPTLYPSCSSNWSSSSKQAQETKHYKVPISSIEDLQPLWIDLHLFIFHERHRSLLSSVRVHLLSTPVFWDHPSYNTSYEKLTDLRLL